MKSSKLYTLVLLKSPGEDWVLSRDRKRLFVTLPSANQVAVVDIRKLIKIQEIQTGRLPAALAFSALSQALYVVHEGDGSLVVLDGQGQKVLTRLRAKPGVYYLFVQCPSLGVQYNQLPYLILQAVGENRPGQPPRPQ